MSYTRRNIEGGVGALRESDDTIFLKPNGQSRNFNIYDAYTLRSFSQLLWNFFVCFKLWQLWLQFYKLIQIFNHGIAY